MPINLTAWIAELDTVESLPKNWKEGKKCPECSADATRQKCMWDMGGICPRHDPHQYEHDDLPWEKDPVAQDRIAFLRGIQNATK